VIVGIEAAEVSRQGGEQVDVEIRLCALKMQRQARRPGRRMAWHIHGRASSHHAESGGKLDTADQVLRLLLRWRSNLSGC
jgi:hypothetical protein